MKYEFVANDIDREFFDYVMMHDGYEALKTFTMRSDAIAYLNGFVVEYIEHQIEMTEEMAEDVADAAGSWSMFIRVTEEGAANIKLNGNTVFSIRGYDESFVELAQK